ncbi:molybdopterin molybdotransferase MoeA [Tellurirhabdus bombi]|uniref:molybdopterin molybdotransferase MoeA n=1 Tax=Tellurirhabdus bombi TaxID=2907205 RepID=UPI001F2095A2|nr:molybdopterin molybdotransferase MoeA [Tellurirhabdus bombi]
MQTVDSASSTIQKYLLTLSAEEVPLEQAAGRMLREPLSADRDMPPFDRVTMDGIAIQYAHYAAGNRTFRIAGIQYAGQPRQQLTDPTACLEVMTGAVLPEGTDTVIRYEDLRIADELAEIRTEAVLEGQSVHRQGSDRLAGTLLVKSGTRLSSAEIAVAASVGKSKLLVTRPPQVIVVSTGDELVDVQETPLPHQIRLSNAYMLKAALEAAGASVTLAHVQDDASRMEQTLRELLAAGDALVLSGGVSAGKADFVPDVLKKIGVQEMFHQIAQRPGKPLWFGVATEAEAIKPVFGLPGNPVSTFLCTYRYLLPWLKASLGLPMAQQPLARLSQPVVFKPTLTYFLPVRLVQAADGTREATPFPGGGSGDYANLLDCDGFMELPADQTHFEVGDAFPIWPFRA